MKKSLLAFLVTAAICVALSACGDKEANTNNRSQIETDSHTYTYQVSPMQGVDSCVYYGPDDYVPNSPDPEAARNKIHIWTKCITCGEDGDHITIPVQDLDFSQGDTIVYSDSCQCFDCYRNNNAPSFMWAVKITRIEDDENK